MFTYKQIEVNVNEDGMFQAIVKGQEVSAISLKACQKQIDKILKQTIPRLKVFKKAGWHNDSCLAECVITSMTDDGYFWATETESKDRSQHSASDFYRDDPEVRRKIVVAQDEIKQLEEKVEELESSIRIEEDELLRMLGIEKKEG